MWTDPDFPTKTALREAIRNGATIKVITPGGEPPQRNGVYAAEGPRTMKPPKWFAKVEVENGLVTKVVG